MRGLVSPDAKAITTRHFVVAYNTPVATVRRLTARLEATYRAVEKFCTFNGIEFKPSEDLLEVLLFDRPEGFRHYSAALGVDARGYNGLYFADTNRSAFFNILNHPNLDEFHRGIQRLEEQVARLHGRKLTAAERAEKRAALKQLHLNRNRRDRFVEKLNRSVVQHEVAHHLLFDGGVHVKGAAVPDWLVEGLACLFETPPSRRGSGLGVTNQMRLTDFRAACGEKRDADNQHARKMTPDDLPRAYGAERFIPLRRLIGLGELSDGPDHANIVYYYAQAWGLTFYLQRTHQEKLAEYIAVLARRAPGARFAPDEEIAQFEAVFGPVDARFERRWAAYIFNLRFIPEFPESR